MNTACPSCGTEYVVSAKDVGRRIVCSGCRKPLGVTETGIRLEAVPDTTPASTPGPANKFLLPRDWATLLFAVGAMLVVWFALMPWIASAGVDRRQAILGSETLDHAAYLKRLRDQNADPGQIAGAEETWQKRRETLQAEVKLAEFDRSRGGYWDRYGLLLGYLVLAVGAIGWTRVGQPLVRRIVGAVVVTGQLLLAFQTVTPMGCSQPARPYNSAAIPSP